MAHYDAHGRRKLGPAAYRPAIVGYSATSESYVSSAEQVVKLGGYPYSSYDQVWPRAQPKIGDDYEYSYSPKFSRVNGSPHDSPRSNSERANSAQHGSHFSMHNTNLNSPHDSPRRYLQGDRGYFSRTVDNNSDDDDDDVECRDGVCYPKPKHMQDYNKEKKKGNGYGEGDDQARKEPRHQTSGPLQFYSTEKLPVANNIYGGNPTNPMTDPYYNRLANPAPIKTRPDHHGDAMNSPGRTTAKWTPFVGPQRKDDPQVIDNTEAHRRHGTAPPQQRTIDSETLAKMYGGVFVK